MWLIVYPCGDFPACWLTLEDSLIFAARLTNNISISTPKHQVLSMSKWTSLHYTYKRLPCLAYQAFHNLALDDINNLFTKRGTPCNLRDDLRLELVCSKSKALYVSFTHRATTSCESTWDTVPYFGIYGLSMILCLWSPLRPLSKFLAIQDHTQNLEEQLWMGGRREVSITCHRPVTRSDLKRERSFFRGSVSTFCSRL